jgi:large subunit ribosomal protein L24
MTFAIKKDDEVLVLAGKDKGHVGRVVRVLPRENRVMVDGAARAKKHERTGQKRAKGGQTLQQSGGIIDVEMFIDASNVAIVCKSCGKPTRIGHRGEGSEKVRICRKCEAEL